MHPILYGFVTANDVNDKKHEKTHSIQHLDKKISLPYTKNKDFWELYCELAEQDLEKPMNLALAECSKTYTPVSVDIVLMYDVPVTADWDFFICVIEVYQEVMREHLEITSDNDITPFLTNQSESSIQCIYTDELLCCHLEPENDVCSKIHKHRIHFPYCKLEQPLHSFLRQKVIDRLRKINAFSKYSRLRKAIRQAG